MEMSGAQQTVACDGRSISPPSRPRLAERGLALEEGWVVLTGGMTDAVRLEPGRPVTAEFT